MQRCFTDFTASEVIAETAIKCEKHQLQKYLKLFERLLRGLSIHSQN